MKWKFINFLNSDSVLLGNVILAKFTVGNKFPQLPDNENYVYKSIGHRTFKKIFSLSELVEVTGANFEDGILHVHLEKNIPEEKKPKVISIK